MKKGYYNFHYFQRVVYIGKSGMYLKNEGIYMARKIFKCCMVVLDLGFTTKGYGSECDLCGKRSNKGVMLFPGYDFVPLYDYDKAQKAVKGLLDELKFEKHG